MVEVPEYLLERSRRRRAELTGQALPEDAPATGAVAGAPAAAGAVTPAVPPPAARPAAGRPVIAPPPPPPPDPPYVKAYKKRKRMPYWAASVMVFLPVWAIFYVGMLEPPDTNELQLAENGSVVFSTCASCHGADGSGTATGRQLNDGEVLLTFPADDDFQGLAQHLSWVYLGTQGSRDLGLLQYGNPERPDGQRVTDSFASGMSGFSNLTLDNLVSVVYYERLTHGGLDSERAALEEEMLLALASDEPTFETGSPDEILELLAESAELHGVGATEGEPESGAGAAAAG